MDGLKIFGTYHIFFKFLFKKKSIRFHVDKYSSAHVYMRLNPGETIDSIPPNVLEDCCQLVKANSIEGKSNDFLSCIINFLRK